MKLPLFIQRIGEAWTSMLKRKALLALAVLADLLFFFGLTRAHHYFIFTRASEAMLTLMQAVQQQANAMTAESFGDMNAGLLSAPGAAAAWNTLLENLALFLLAAFVLWLVCKGIAWYCAARAVNKNVRLPRYAAGFAGASALGFAAWILVLLIGAAGSQAALSPLPLIGPGTVQLLTIILTLTALYALWAAYATLPQLQLRVVLRAFVKWRAWLPAFLTAATLSGTLFLDALWAINLSTMGGFAFIIVMALPGFALGRVLLMRAGKRL